MYVAVWCGWFSLCLLHIRLDMQTCLVVYMYTPQNKFINPWWSICGSRNCKIIWNARDARSTRCTNLTFTPFNISKVIVNLIIYEWGYINNMFVSNDSTKTNWKIKCWVVSFGDPCDVNDGVMPGHARIVTCDMLSMFPYIRLILNRCLRSTLEKEPKYDRFFLWMSKPCLGALHGPSAVRARNTFHWLVTVYL